MKKNNKLFIFLIFLVVFFYELVVSLLLKSYLISSISFFLVLTVLYFIIIFNYVSPYEKMLECISKIKEGDFSVRISCKQNNFMYVLAKAFNELIHKIDHKNKQIMRYNMELETLTQNIPGGVYIYSIEENFKITYMSDGFLSLLGYCRHDSETKNMSYTDIIYKKDLLNVISKINQQIFDNSSIDLEYRVVDRNGNKIWVIDKGKVVTNSFGAKTLQGVIIEINHRKSQEKKLIDKIQTDSLSGLYTKNFFEEKARRQMKVNFAKSIPIWFMFLDIDDFKDFNTLYGHGLGDCIIRCTGKIISQSIDKIGFASRFGGDEFIICIHEEINIENVVVSIIENLKEGIKTEDLSYSINCSIGIVESSKDNLTYEQVVQMADNAMYKVKNSGKNSYFIA